MPNFIKRNMKEWLQKNNSLTSIRLVQISLALFIFGYHDVANMVVVLVFLLSLWSLGKDGLKTMIQNKYVWFFWGYVLITLLGISYSSNVSQGFKYVEMRLLLILFPVIFFSLRNSILVLTILRWFILMVFAGAFIGLINSTILYIQTMDFGYFFNDNLVSLINKQATYYSIYVNLALVFIVYFFGKFSDKEKAIYLIIGSILILFQILLAVRISLFTFLILIFLGVFNLPVKKRRLYGASAVLGVITISILSVLFFPQTINRLKSMSSNFRYEFDNPNPVNHFNGEVKSENWNGLTLRLALWHCGIDIIKENPVFGVGSGDYKGEMNLQFEKKNFIYALDQNFGVHNQYLYSWISFGLLGLLSIYLLILPSARYAWLYENHLYLSFVLIFFLVFITENALNRYMGIYIYGLFNSSLFFLRTES